MTNQTEKFKALISDKKSGWLDKAKYRQENQDWLDISFAIAVKILSSLRENKKKDIAPKNQKELSEVLDCSPQYVSKLLKGTEKLNIETISKIQKALDIKIINNSIIKGQEEVVVKNEAKYKKQKVTQNNYTKSDNVITFNFASKEFYSNSTDYREVINE